MHIRVLCIGALGVYLFSPSLVKKAVEPEALDREAIEREVEERPIFRTREVRPIKPIAKHVRIAMNLIKKYEGFRSEPYRCSAGVLTIGYGETDPAIVSRGYISESDALSLLKEKVVMISNEIDNEISIDLTAHQRAALISFYYNLGPGNFNNIARRINRGNIDEARDAILLYDKCEGRRLEGLTKRREEEQYLFTL